MSEPDYTKIVKKAINVMDSLESLRDILKTQLDTIDSTILEIANFREEIIVNNVQAPKTPPNSPIILPTIPEEHEEEHEEDNIFPEPEDQELEDQEPEEPEEPEDQDPEEPNVELDPSQYGLMRKPISGSVQVCLVGLNWTDLKCQRVDLVGPKLQKLYNNASNGLLKMKVVTKVVSVPFNHSGPNLYKAVDYAKAVVIKANNGKPYDIYIMMHSHARAFSNATGGIAFCKDTSLRTIMHEVGHLKPFKLQHANKLDITDARGRVTTTGRYKDPTSFMGKFVSWKFNAPEFLYLGWLQKEKIAVFDQSMKEVEYQLEPLYSSVLDNGLPSINIGKEGNYKVIIIKKDGKDLILSSEIFVEKINNKNTNVQYFLLYTTYGGTASSEIDPGSTILGKFKENKVYDNWKITKINDLEDNSSRIKITYM